MKCGLKYFICVLSISYFSMVSPSHSLAIGLSVTYSDLTFNNLKVGASYNVKDLVGYPFKISYRGDRNTGVSIEPMIPTRDLIKKEGIEPVPDVSWIKVLTQHFELQPGESGNTDMILTIPNDVKLMGRAFQLTLNTHTDSAAGGMIGVGVNTNLILKIAEKEESNKEKQHRLAKEIVNKMSFNVVPDKIQVFDAEIGRKVDLKKEHEVSFKIVNTSSDKLVANVNVIPIEKTDISAPKEYDTPSPDYLILNTNKVSIAPDNIKEIKMTLNLPNDPKYAKSKHFFVVKIEPLNTDLKVSFNVRVYVETK